jgi:hypothetical protein
MMFSNNILIGRKSRVLQVLPDFDVNVEVDPGHCRTNSGCTSERALTVGWKSASIRSVFISLASFIS